MKPAAAVLDLSCTVTKLCGAICLVIVRSASFVLRAPHENDNAT
jgi:hypothetical protein